MWDQPDKLAVAECVGSTERRTITGRLRDKKQRLEAELKAITDALDKLEAHPEIAEALDSVNNALRF